MAGDSQRYSPRSPEDGSQWYFSRKEIEENSPSKLDGVDLKKEAYLRKSYCSFLQDLGMRLKVWVFMYFNSTICFSQSSFVHYLSCWVCFCEFSCLYECVWWKHVFKFSELCFYRSGENIRNILILNMFIYIVISDDHYLLELQIQTHSLSYNNLILI